MAPSSDKPAVPAKLVDATKTEFVRTPNYRSVFANYIRVVTSPNEVRITFSHSADVIREGDTQYLYEDEVAVVIPPALIRSFLQIIESSLENHEKLWGKLPEALNSNAQDTE